MIVLFGKVVGVGFCAVEGCRLPATAALHPADRPLLCLRHLSEQVRGQ